MSDHSLITDWARDSVIAGFLEPIRAPLDALGSYRYDEIKDASWAPQLAQLQAAARITSSAATLDAAAMGVAAMGRVCGECHAQRHAGPLIEPEPEPDPDKQLVVDNVPGRMDLHTRASDLMWLGLTGPSDISWKAGTDALIHAPTQLDQELPAPFDRDLEEIRSIAQQASGASSLAERADVYGLLISTCADCHSRWVEDAHPARDME